MLLHVTSTNIQQCTKSVHDEFIETAPMTRSVWGAYCMVCSPHGHEQRFCPLQTHLNRMVLGSLFFGLLY